MKLYFFLVSVTIILGIYSCSSQSFPSLSMQLEKKYSKSVNSKMITFHDLRVDLYKNGKLDFINYTRDTLYILESYDIQDASYRGRLWNKRGYVQYNYTKKSGFEFNEDRMFTKYTLELIQKWDTTSIRAEESLYSNTIPIFYLYCSRIIFSNQSTIDCLKFKEFFNSKRDSR